MEAQKVEVLYKDIRLADGSPNEEFLAALRNRLKEMEEKGQTAMLVPVCDGGDCKDVDAALELTAAYKHCARRVKDCQSVLGFGIPAVFAGMAQRIAMAAKSPIAMHLDHGSSYELAGECVRAGYTSVMIDASMKEWKEIRLADGKEGWIETRKMEVI